MKLKVADRIKKVLLDAVSEKDLAKAERLMKDKGKKTLKKVARAA
jgi:hypothetical protein